MGNGTEELKTALVKVFDLLGQKIQFVDAPVAASSAGPGGAPEETPTETAGQRALAVTFARSDKFPSGPGKMPKLPEVHDLFSAIAYARCGYDWRGDAQRGPEQLAEAHAEIDKIASVQTEEEWRAGPYGTLYPEMACYALLTRRIPLPSEPYQHPSLWVGVGYPSIQALLDREVYQFGAGFVTPGQG